MDIEAFVYDIKDTKLNGNGHGAGTHIFAGKCDGNGSPGEYVDIMNSSCFNIKGCGHYILGYTVLSPKCLFVKGNGTGNGY